MPSEATPGAMYGSAPAVRLFVEIKLTSIADVLKAMPIPAPTSDLNRTAVYEQIDTSHIAAFIRSQKNSSFGNLF